MKAAPGWYPDPTGTHGELRYFDGQQWTEHRAAAAPTAAPFGAPAPRTRTTPDGRPLASWGSRVGAALLDVLISGALFAALLAPLWITVFRGMFDNLRHWMNTHPSGASPTNPFFIYDGHTTAIVWLGVL
ncbi:MAG: DUF2510 domain-containing protein, partial [Marmoricola sp.]